MVYSLETNLAEFKHEKADPSPFVLGKSASRETRTESMNMEPVREARRASLFFMAGAERPRRPYDTDLLNRSGFLAKAPITLSSRKPRILLSHLQFAQITKTSLQKEMKHTSSNACSYLRNRRVRDPCLTSSKDKPAVHFFGGGFHSSRVGTVVRFGKPLYGCQRWF